MSLNLPDHISLPVNPGRYNTAIAEVVFWSHVWVFGIILRSLQEWHYWEHSQKREVFRCILYGWGRNLIVLLAQIRVVGFVLYLAKPSADKGLVITEVVLQGVGVSPLTLELSLVLLKCGRVGLKGKKVSHYSQLIKTLLNWTRLPIFIGIVLICVAGGIVNTALLKAGAVMILVAFVYLVTILIVLSLNGQYKDLPIEGQRGVMLVVAALPFYVIRMVYMMLGDFGNVKYSPAIGDWKMAVGLEFVMEIVIVILLISAMVVVQPVLGKRLRQSDSHMDVEVQVSKGETTA